MTPRGHLAFLCIAFLSAAPLFAQAPPDDRIQQLEQRLNDLTREVGQIRQELDQLKGAAAAAPSPATTAAADQQDLTKVDIVNAPTTAPAPPVTAEVAQATPGTPATAEPSIADVQTVNNVPTPGASKVFNPDISVIGNFFGKAGQRNPYEFGPASDQVRQTFRLDEAEVAFQAFVDPYAKANFFLAATPEGLDVEEGYIQFVTLPYDLTAKVGKFKEAFGKANTWHTHVRPWVDQPLVIHNFFGDEQLHDDGISFSKVFPNSKNVYVEATGELLRGQLAGVFDNPSQNDVSYNAHLKAFKDISENSNLELGTSYARGTALSGAGANQFTGLDLTYRWKPLQQGLYRGFIGRFEAIGNRNADLDHRLFGFYASGDYQLAQRWFTGLRIDRADRGTPFDNGDVPVDPDRGFRATDRGVSATLTFWPSEFSQLRGQVRRTSYGGAKSVTEFLFQLQFAIGAHGAHSF
ncbi:MAG TPA: hypothetical protein VN605_09685 [Thermoanaerobaculia bacterium]|nr:hypothetical protein [Thermoanaerobaculia bacterium]